MAASLKSREIAAATELERASDDLRLRMDALVAGDAPEAARQAVAECRAILSDAAYLMRNPLGPPEGTEA